MKTPFLNKVNPFYVYELKIFKFNFYDNDEP